MCFNKQNYVFIETLTFMVLHNFLSSVAISNVYLLIYVLPTFDTRSLLCAVAFRT